jgi:hypothetical protein
MIVELPLVIPDKRSAQAKFVRHDRKTRIRNSRSLQSISEEIAHHDRLEECGLIKFNHPNRHGKIPLPILTMESDDLRIGRTRHKKIALFVGKRLHRKYRCQVQVVWSGNKSYHVHFRIHRHDVVRAEAIAIQKVLTLEMERRVRRRFGLPDFCFDRAVMMRLELVRLGGGTRVEIDGKPVSVKQRVVKYWHSDFRDPDTVFPMNDELKKALSTATARKARSRAKTPTGHRAVPQPMELRAYGRFLRRVGSTVRPSHWGYKDGSTPVLICYYGPRDRNPSCVLGLDSYFVTDSRGRKHPVVYSYQDYQQARRNDFRGGRHG